MVSLCSARPAEILNIKNKGEIKAGNIADIAIIDPDLKYIYDKNLNKSKSINSPLFNKELTGAAICTIKNGRVVFEFPNIVA